LLDLLNLGKCLDRLICAGFCRRRVEYLNGLAVCCTSSGRYVAIECKATDQDRFKRSEVSQVQAAHLDAAVDAFALDRSAVRLGRLVDLLEDAFRRRHALLGGRADLGELADRLGVRPVVVAAAPGASPGSGVRAMPVAAAPLALTVMAPSCVVTLNSSPERLAISTRSMCSGDTPAALPRTCSVKTMPSPAAGGVGLTWVAA